MSLVTQMMVAERYGIRLGVEQIAEVLGVKKSSIYARICDGSLGIPTYTDIGKTWADYRDVAAYLDRCRESARAA